MSRVTFHSDDAGATREVTKRIIGAWSLGLIESFSILANGDALSEVSDALLREAERDVRIAAHLNLCEGPSLAYKDRATYITDEKGHLSARFFGLIKSWTFSSPKAKSDLLEQVEAEWRAQIERVMEACSPRTVQALDGHIHMHMLPFLFPIAARLAKHFGIPEIRVANEVFHVSGNMSETLNPAFVVNLTKHIVLRLCAKINRKHVDEYGLLGPTTMIGVLYTGRMTATSAKKGIIAARKKKKEYIEVLFHIGRGAASESERWASCPDIGQFYFSEWRDKEYDELVKLRSEMSSAVLG